MSDYETGNNGCGCGYNNSGSNYPSTGGNGCGCNILGLSDDTLLIIAIIILFILLFCGNN